MSDIKKLDGLLIGTKSESRVKRYERIKDILLDNLNNMGPKWYAHLPLFLGAPELARILWFNEIYQKIIDVPGVIIEFGSQYGASLNTFSTLRTIYEPYNVSRKILSFSTFASGFVNTDQKDGTLVSDGDYSVPLNWEYNIKEVINTNSFNDNKIEIFDGDASKTFAEYLKNHPELIISCVHFDMDIYKPTKDALELCLKFIPKGGIIVFDELNHPGFPGETIAIQEVIGIKNLRLFRNQFQPYAAYYIV
jgi:hypothetical protein